MRDGYQAREPRAGSGTQAESLSLFLPVEDGLPKD